VGRARPLTEQSREYGFLSVFGSGRGRGQRLEQQLADDEAVENERAITQEQRARAERERIRQAQIQRGIEADRARQAQKSAKADRIRVVMLKLLDEREEWEPEEFREAARSQLDKSDHDWVPIILTGMCGDGGPIKLTPRLNIRKAPPGQASRLDRLK